MSVASESASASPSRCASASTSSKLAPLARHRGEDVVAGAVDDAVDAPSCGRRRAPPSACAGSGCRRRRWPRSRAARRARSAAATISSPCTASSALLAVTTSLPRAIASQDEAPRRLVAADQLDHDVDVGVVAAGRVGVARQAMPPSSRTPRSRRQVEVGDARRARAARPARCAISARCARSSFTTPVPIVPKPISPTRTAPCRRAPGQPALCPAARPRRASRRAPVWMPRIACRVRCSFSISAKRT